MPTTKLTVKRNLVMSPKVTKSAVVVRPLGPHLRTNSNTTRGTDSTSHSSGDDLQLVDPKTTSMPSRKDVIPFGDFDEHEMDGFTQYGAFGDFSDTFDFTAHPSRDAFQAAPSNTWGQSQTSDFVIQDDGESEYEEESIDDEEYEAYMASQQELAMSQGEIEYVEEWVPVDDDEEFEEITVGSDEYDAYLQHLVGEGAPNGCAGEVMAIIGRELKVEKTIPADPGNSSESKGAAEEKKKKKIKKVKKKETKDKKEKGSDAIKVKKSSSSTDSKTKLKSSTSPVKTPKSIKKKATSSDEQKTTEKVKKTSKITIPKVSKKSADCSLSVKTPDNESPSKSRKRVPSLSLSPSTPEEEVKQALESTNGVKLSKEPKEVKAKKMKTHKSTESDGGTKVSPSRPTKETAKDVSLSIKSSSKTLKLKKPKSLSHIIDEGSQSVFSAPLETKSKSKKRSSSSRKSTDSVGGSSSRSILSAPNLRSSKVLKSRKDRLERKKATLGIEENGESLASLSSKLKKSTKSSSSVSEAKKSKSSKAESEVSLKSPTTKTMKVSGSKSLKGSSKDTGGTDLSKSSNASTKDIGAKEATNALTPSKSKKPSSKSMTMVVKPTLAQESPRRSVRVIRYCPKGKD